MLDVSIIIINYNTYDLTLNTIKGLIEFTKGIKYQIILADNASLDGSGNKLKNYFGDKITYLGLNENLGTSKTFNIALKEAQGKYVLWLNPDVVFTENFIKKLYDFMEKHDDCGVCGGNLTDMEGTPLHSYREKITSYKSLKQDKSFLFAFIKKFFKRKKSGEYNFSSIPKKVGYITGADMMTRKELLDSLGGFEEEIFMYAEETEFQYRILTKTDYKIYSVPYAKLIHLEGQSLSKNTFSARRHFLCTQGTSIYLKKSFGENDAKKYLKNLIVSYRKIKFIYTVLRRKQQIENYAKKIENAKYILENFDNVSILKF